MLQWCGFFIMRDFVLRSICFFFYSFGIHFAIAYTSLTLEWFSHSRGICYCSKLVKQFHLLICRFVRKLWHYLLNGCHSDRWTWTNRQSKQWDKDHWTRKFDNWLLAALTLAICFVIKRQKSSTCITSDEHSHIYLRYCGCRENEWKELNNLHYNVQNTRKCKNRQKSNFHSRI